MKELYESPDLTPTTYKAESDEQAKLLADLDARRDADAMRMRRFLNMADLSRTVDSPLKEIVDRVKQLQIFKKFDDIETPDIVTTQISFDLFNFPPDHPARKTSDTYYLDTEHILRTQTTVMWYYYFMMPEIKERLAKNMVVGAVSYGKVYRKDEIDRRHMNIFHQIDGLFLCPKSVHEITQDDLKEVLTEVAQGILGTHIKFRFNPDTFPYTHSSVEMEVDKNSMSGEHSEPLWVEVLGAGVVEPGVLEKLGVDSTIYNGWAFGFGLERLAIISMELPDIRLLWSTDERVKKQLKLGQKFVEVSKYPPVVRDISFIANDDFVPNNYFDLVRDVVGDTAEEMALIDTYKNAEKFGEGKVSYAYRITYRSLDRTLTDTEVNTLHKQLERATIDAFGAIIR